MQLVMKELMNKSTPGIDKFFALAQERYRIHINKSGGHPKPWSDDPIFQREYFCNVFREDDKTTAWFRENIRSKIIDPKKLLLAIVAFRWFNKIETGKIIKPLLLDDWSSEAASERLLGVSPVVTGAYIIKTPDGMNKMTGVLWCIDKFIETMEKEWNYFSILCAGKYSMQTACELLKRAPYLGNFMAWQICSDAAFTSILENAHDRDTWAQPGPGSARGLGRVFYNDVDHFKYDSGRDQTEMLALMNDLSSRSKDVQYWPSGWPTMNVMTVSHQLCEYDKYCRAEEGGRMKRKYNAS